GRPDAERRSGGHRPMAQERPGRDAPVSGPRQRSLAMNTVTSTTLATLAPSHPARRRLFTLRRLVGTAGPGMLIAVGYIDPGNWATDLSGGARYGYALLSMILIANVIAMVVQALCVRLAITTGKSLAEHSRDAHSRPVVLMLWLSAELAMIMTDLAELVG